MLLLIHYLIFLVLYYVCRLGHILKSENLQGISKVFPMHNILLAPKCMIAVWKEKGYLSPNQFEYVQMMCDRFIVIVPAGVGRIPHKISSGFTSFTADQWKNWTLIYSLVVLKNILQRADYFCWKMYVKACGLVCSKAITLDAVGQCHDYLLAFCKNFEQLYNGELCTPNMHAPPMPYSIMFG